MTTSKATYTPQPRIMKAPPTKLISTENFYLEVERVRAFKLRGFFEGRTTRASAAGGPHSAPRRTQDRHEGPANGTFGATLPAHPKAEEKMNLETTYRAQFTDTTSATARLRQTAAEPVPAAAEGEAMGTGGAPRRQVRGGERLAATSPSCQSPLAMCMRCSSRTVPAFPPSEIRRGTGRANGGHLQTDCRGAYSGGDRHATRRASNAT